MNTSKAKFLIILLVLVDIIISAGLIFYKSSYIDRNVQPDIGRLLIDIFIIILALYGIKWMKNIYLFMLFFTGIISVFYSLGIFITKNNKSLGLILLLAGVYYIFMFFIFIYSKAIDSFFRYRQDKFKMNYRNHRIKQ